MTRVTTIAPNNSHLPKPEGYSIIPATIECQHHNFRTLKIHVVDPQDFPTPSIQQKLALLCSPPTPVWTDELQPKYTLAYNHHTGFFNKTNDTSKAGDHSKYDISLAQHPLNPRQSTINPSIAHQLRHHRLEPGETYVLKGDPTQKHNTKSTRLGLPVINGIEECHIQRRQLFIYNQTLRSIRRL